MATILHSYEMHGVKEDFADFISNISPEYTPFISMLKKFPITNTSFNWQTDELTAPNGDNAYEEGSEAADVTLTPTTIVTNTTQIMRKVVMVSDTADAVSSYGRQKELFYQLKKAAKELNRDVEAILLQKEQRSIVGTSSTAGQTSSLGWLIMSNQKFPVNPNGTDFEQVLFDLTHRLYSEGAEPEVIMYHPTMAKMIAALQEKTGDRQRIFENDKRYIKQVEYIVDPLGQELKCIPNRWCPEGVAYVMNMEDLSMAVLRAPKETLLSKSGSYTKYMIEQEIGLRLSNPKAAAMLYLTA